MISFIKKVIRIYREFDQLSAAVHEQQIAMSRLESSTIRWTNSLKCELDETKDFIRKATTVNADIPYHSKDSGTIIVMGEYRGKAYIESYRVGKGDFNHWVDELRQMRKYGRIDVLDAPPVFRAIIEREEREL